MIKKPVIPTIQRIKVSSNISFNTAFMKAPFKKCFYTLRKKRGRENIVGWQLWIILFQRINDKSSINEKSPLFTAGFSVGV